MTWISQVFTSDNAWWNIFHKALSLVFFKANNFHYEPESAYLYYLCQLPPGILNNNNNVERNHPLPGCTSSTTTDAALHLKQLAIVLRRSIVQLNSRSTTVNTTGGHPLTTQPSLTVARLHNIHPITVARRSNRQTNTSVTHNVHPRRINHPTTRSSGSTTDRRPTSRQLNVITSVRRSTTLRRDTHATISATSGNCVPLKIYMCFLW